MTRVRIPVLAIALGLVNASLAQAQPKEESVTRIYLQVSALSALYDLGATPEQVKALKDLSSDTASRKPLPDLRPGRPYRAAITALRDAYAKNDDNEIGDCQERLTNLEEKMDDPPDPEVEITDAARKKAKDALRLFTAAQVTDYIAEHSDDSPDPEADLIAAFDEVRGQPDREFARTRRRIAGEIATDVAGIEGQKFRKVHDTVAALLDKVHGLSDDDFKTQRPELDRQAKEITAGAPGPVQVIGHWIERDFAELLSNPELAMALQARGK